MDPDFENMCELWKQTQRESRIKTIVEKNIHIAKKYIQNFTNRFTYDSSKMAELMWRNTLREDWVNIIYQENFDILDILDMELSDIISLDINDTTEFYRAILNIRDNMAIAEIVYLFDPQVRLKVTCGTKY